MRVKYKVVKENRTSCFVLDESKYCLSYQIGKIVKSKKSTLGIFCFKTKFLANKFIVRLSERVFDLERYKIIRVVPLKRGTTQKYICGLITELDFFYKDKICRTAYIPKGTICYPEVLVLD